MTPETQAAYFSNRCAKSIEVSRNTWAPCGLLIDHSGPCESVSLPRQTAPSAPSLQAAFSEVREALDGAWWEYPNALKRTEDGQLVAKMLANGKEKLARIESELARLENEAQDAAVAWAEELGRLADVNTKLARLKRIEEAAKNAKVLSAAPDYDEEALRDALWAVVTAAGEGGDREAR